MTEQQTANNEGAENLTGNGSGATISASGNTEGNATSAELSGSEDTLEGLKAVIEQQKSVIDVLTEQVGSFKEQMETAIRKGAAVGNVSAEKPNISTDGQSVSGSASDDYKYLKDLDYRIEKSDYYK